MDLTPFPSCTRYAILARRVEPLGGSVRLADKDSQLTGTIRGGRRGRRQQAVSIQRLLHMLLLDPGDNAM